MNIINVHHAKNIRKFVNNLKYFKNSTFFSSVWIWNPVLYQSVIWVLTRTLKVKQHWPWSVLDRIVPLGWFVKDQGYDWLWSLLICATVKYLTSFTGHQSTKSREPSSSWRIKIVMAYLRTTLRGESQTVGNCALHNFSPTLNPYNQPINFRNFDIR